MTESAKLHDPVWDTLNLPVLTEVVDVSPVPTLADEVVDVPYFDFSSELNAIETELAVLDPNSGSTALEIPDLLLEEGEEILPDDLQQAELLDLQSLPSLDLNEQVVPDLSLAQLLPEAVTEADESEQAFDFSLEPAEPATESAESEPSVADLVEEPKILADIPVGEAGEVAQLKEFEALPASEPLETIPDTAAFAEMAVPEPSSAASAPSFTSIPLDSLPTGVLGGGLGLAGQAEADLATEFLASSVSGLAEQVPGEAPQVNPQVGLVQSNVMVEAAGAADLDSVHLSDEIVADSLSTLSPQQLEPSLIEVVDEQVLSEHLADSAEVFAQDELVTNSVVAVPPTRESADNASAQTSPAKTVEVINIAAVATAASAAMMVSSMAGRQGAVTVLDEQALLDSLYEKVLPQMKEELMLWLQDALNLQTKQMLTGVMDQIKEDYEMLFGEALKESLRQTLQSLGKAEREDTPRD
ncbi:hypothetical protein HZU77_003895 [Neisseriaceae bacterium TC5R-5]|nr:hypothetical protein [Neisseriaceae bacterium TC5R-5]